MTLRNIRSIWFLAAAMLWTMSAALAQQGRGSSSMTLAFAAQEPQLWPDELDAVRAAPNSHKVLFENEVVRVLEVRVPPGTKEAFHQQRLPSIFINLDAGGPTGASRYYNQDGKMTRDTPRTIKPGASNG